MINKDMYVADVLNMNENLVPVFLRHGLFCIGCSMAHGETIEEACLAHGLDLDSLIDDLNRNNEQAPAEA